MLLGWIWKQWRLWSDAEAGQTWGDPSSCGRDRCEYGLVRYHTLTENLLCVCVFVCVCTDYLLIIFISDRIFHQILKKITILDKILLNFPHHSAQNMFSQKVKKQRKRWAHLFSPNLWLSWRRNSPLTLYFLKMIDETSHLRLPVALSRCPSVTLSSWVFRFDPGLLMEVMPWSH